MGQAAGVPDTAAPKNLTPEEAQLTLRALDLQLKSLERSIKAWETTGRTAYVRPAQQEREQIHAVMSKLRA